MSGNFTTTKRGDRSSRRLGMAWLSFILALAVHVTDEALTDFLSIYNPTVQALRAYFGFWPMPTFTFGVWLAALSLGIIALLALSPFAFRNARWFRPFCFVVVVVAGVANALGHTIATILGRTVSSVTFPRPAPGFYSSPLVLAAACWVLLELSHIGKPNVNGRSLCQT